MSQVVTYMTPTGDTMNICGTCEAALLAARDWPKDGTGREYAQVSQGRHTSECESPVHPVHPTP